MLAKQVMTIARDETGNATVPTTAKIVISALITMMVVAVAPWTTIGEAGVHIRGGADLTFLFKSPRTSFLVASRHITSFIHSSRHAQQPQQQSIVGQRQIETKLRQTPFLFAINTQYSSTYN